MKGPWCFISVWVQQWTNGLTQARFKASDSFVKLELSMQYMIFYWGGGGSNVYETCIEEAIVMTVISICRKRCCQGISNC
jgi:hypothetical protein